MPSFRVNKPPGNGMPRGNGMSRGGRGGRGRAGFGDRGGRGRGGRGGRGRGRGRGGNTSKFASARLGETHDEDSDDADGDIPDDVESIPSDDHDEISASSESEDEGPSGLVPYNALLQSFKSTTRDTEPQRKRRKLDRAPQEHGVRESGDMAEDSVEHEEEQMLDMEPDAEDDGDEEGPENDEDDDMQSSADEDETDPFELHFANPDEDELSNKIKAAQENSWTPQKLSPSADYKMTGQYPGNFTPRHVPGVEGLVDKGFNIKPRLSEASRKLLKKATALEQALFPIIFDNQDLLFGARTPSNADRLRNLVSLHALNHLYKTRDRIIKNNTKLARDKTGSLELRDQGFTRPKVLILTATRSACYKIVQAMLAIASPEQQENKKRFEDAFILDNPIPSDRPADYIDLFAGNNDDEFRVGMKFTRKTVKFFSKFANSDIILASPLGLRRSLTTTDKKGSPPNTDFLSSIEICIVDQADALLMQNWDHLTHIFTHLNALPRNPAGTDFSRVRNWCLNAHSPFLRQTILLAAYLTPDLNALFTAHMRNIAGRVKICPANYPGHLAVPMPIKQTFNRIAAPSPLAAPDTRFAHFCTAIVPALAARSKRASANSSTTAAGTLVCVPSYYDFVRLRNFFATSTAAQNISFGAISEYSSPTQVRQARSHFGTGRFSVLLYSGRAHHFQRYRIRGVRSVVWYGVPDNAVFYGEGLEMVLASVEKGVVGVGEARVRMLFTRWDGLGLERVVGSERVRGMVGEAMGDVFEFV